MVGSQGGKPPSLGSQFGRLDEGSNDEGGENAAQGSAAGLGKAGTIHGRALVELLGEARGDQRVVASGESSLGNADRESAVGSERETR